MNLYKSKTYVSDIQKVIKSITYTHSCSVLITGSTGLICSAVVDLLAELNLTGSSEIKLFIAARSKEKVLNRFSKYINYKWFNFVQYNATEPFNFSQKVDYIIHGASNAYPEVIGKYPVETFSSNVFGISEILKYANNTGAKVLYVSSSEVYGLHQNNNLPLNENDYGYIDVLNSRSSYSLGKVAAENLCASYAKEFGINFVIVRPGHIYGPTASKSDNRVSSQFMYSAVEGKSLVLKSNGEQIRSYCYCLDCASAIIAVLFNGVSGNAYNISNKESVISIRHMAELIAEYANVRLEFDIPDSTEKANFNPMLNSSLNAEKLYELGWCHSFSCKEGFEHSIQIIKESV